MSDINQSKTDSLFNTIIIIWISTEDAIISWREESTFTYAQSI